MQRNYNSRHKSCTLITLFLLLVLGYVSTQELNIRNENNNENINTNNNDININTCCGKACDDGGDNGGDTRPGSLDGFEFSKICQILTGSEIQQYQCSVDVSRDKVGQNVPTSLLITDIPLDYNLSTLVETVSTPKDIVVDASDLGISATVDVAKYLSQVGDSVTIGYIVDTTDFEPGTYCNNATLFNSKFPSTNKTVDACFNVGFDNVTEPQLNVAKQCQGSEGSGPYAPTNCSIEITLEAPGSLEIVTLEDRLFVQSGALDFPFDALTFTQDEYSDAYNITTLPDFDDRFVININQSQFEEFENDTIVVSFTVNDNQLTSGETYCDSVLYGGSAGQAPNNVTACFLPNLQTVNFQYEKQCFGGSQPICLVKVTRSLAVEAGAVFDDTLLFDSEEPLFTFDSVSVSPFGGNITYNVSDDGTQARFTIDAQEFEETGEFGFVLLFSLDGVPDGEYCDRITASSSSLTNVTECFEYTQNGTRPQITLDKSCESVDFRTASCQLRVDVIGMNGTDPLIISNVSLIDVANNYNISLIDTESITVEPEDALDSFAVDIESGLIEFAIDLDKARNPVATPLIIRYDIDTTNLEDGLYQDTINIPGINTEASAKFPVDRCASPHECTSNATFEVEDTVTSDVPFNVSVNVEFDGVIDAGKSFYVSLQLNASSSVDLGYSSETPGFENIHCDPTPLCGMAGDEEESVLICTWVNCELIESEDPEQQQSSGKITQKFIATPAFSDDPVPLTIAMEQGSEDGYCGNETIGDVKTISVNPQITIPEDCITTTTLEVEDTVTSDVPFNVSADITFDGIINTAAVFVVGFQLNASESVELKYEDGSGVFENIQCASEPLCAVVEDTLTCSWIECKLIEAEQSSGKVTQQFIATETQAGDASSLIIIVEQGSEDGYCGDRNSGDIKTISIQPSSSNAFTHRKRARKNRGIKRRHRR